MLIYTNEITFSRSLCACLKNRRWFVQRIESGTTGVGIPDLYTIDTEGKARWLELKRVRCTWTPGIQIPWRPGQEAWLHEVVQRLDWESAFTLACFNDCIIRIQHDKLYPNSFIYRCESISEVPSMIQLSGRSF